MGNRVVIGVVIALIAILSIAPSLRVTQTPAGIAIAQELPRDKTLIFVAVTAAFGDSFNPFTATAPGVDLVLPPLYVFNFITDEWHPLIADYSWENDTVLVIKIRPEAKWHDGTPVTSDDVIFTFRDAFWTICNITRYWWCGYYPRTWIGWERVDDKTVKLYINSTLVRAYRTIPWVFASWVRLAPAHIFRTLDNKTWHTEKFRDPAKGWPIGCGPYRLKYFDPAMVVYERVDDWWGWKYVREYGIRVGVLKPDEPYPTESYPPKYIVWRAVASADIARALLIAGDADLVGTPIPGIEAYARFGIGAWFKKSPWYHPYAAWTVYIQHIPPITIPEVKKAVFLAINREAIATRVQFGYATPIDEPIGFPPIRVYRDPTYYNETWIKEKFREIYGVSWPINYTLAKEVARRLLSEAQINGTRLFEWDATKKRFVWATDITLSVPGYTVTFKKGDVLELTFITGAVPSPDDAAVLDQIRRDLADIGIELKVYLSPDSWREFNVFCKGHFHMASYFIVWTLGPAARAIPGQLAYVDPMYNETHSVAEVTPCGVATPGWNPGRYGSTKEPHHILYSQLFANLTYVPITDIIGNKRIVDQLLEIFLKDPPFITIAGIPIGDTYSTQYWTGWPTADNPYATPWYGFTARSGYFTYLLLKPVPRPTPTPEVTTVPTTVVTTMYVPTTVPTTIVTTLPGETVPTTIVTYVPTTIPTTVVTMVPTTVPIPTTVVQTEIPDWVYGVIAVLIIVVIGVVVVALRRKPR
jgi:peptide/nickel transport system substrate-binding protein